MMVMKKSLKKAIVMIVSFMFLGLGVTSNCLSLEDHVGEFRKDVGLTSEMYFNTKFSDYITGTATIVNSGYPYEAESSTDINDWTADNYTIKSPVSLNDFYVELWKENLSGGVGLRTFPEREGLVSALQDIEYQFFPVDATNPLRMKRIGVPGVWGKYYFSPTTYVKLAGYETIWSKISPEAVPDMKHMKLDNPTGDLGYSLFTSLGTRIDDTAIEVGFTRGSGSWPSEEREPTSEFSPNPYKLSAAYIKVRKHFDSWVLGNTALVKDANENAGSIYNMLFSVDKELSLWERPVSIGVSYFYVQSFEQSRHLRTSPWDDLGNSFSFRATIEDKDQQVRHGFEGVVNHEELGFYLMGITEKSISDLVKLRTQMDFVYDRQKYISEEYDSIRIAGYVTYTF
jgi:hypothetical protein